MIEALHIGGVFLAGLVSFFSPCILPIIPVFISTLLTSADDKPKMVGKLRLNFKALGRVTLFVLGLSMSFILLGLTFSSLGLLISRNQNIILLVSGIIVVLFGIYQTGIVKIPFLMKEKKVSSGKQRKGLLGAFILGFTFSLGWTPCVGPILTAVIALTAGQGSLVLGAVYMAVYSLGLLIPFLVFTIFSDQLLGRIRGIYKYMNVIKIIGGVILVSMGVVLILSSQGLISINNIASGG